MNRHSLVASFGLVAGMAAALSAQTMSSNVNVNQKTIQSIRVKVIGCVVRSTEAGRYRLTNALLSGDDIPVNRRDGGEQGLRKGRFVRE